MDLALNRWHFTTAELTGLERRVELVFRIIAENSAGSSSTSNTVTAVL